jgi:hypothetical protein
MRHAWLLLRVQIDTTASKNAHQRSSLLALAILVDPVHIIHLQADGQKDRAATEPRNSPISHHIDSPPIHQQARDERPGQDKWAGEQIRHASVLTEAVASIRAEDFLDIVDRQRDLEARGLAQQAAEQHGHGVVARDEPEDGDEEGGEHTGSCVELACADAGYH